MTWFLGIAIFFIGSVVGTFVARYTFENQEWRVMKWNSDALGYRPAGIGSKLFRNDKVAMAIEIDSSQFPDEGVVVE